MGVSTFWCDWAKRLHERYGRTTARYQQPWQALRKPVPMVLNYHITQQGTNYNPQMRLRLQFNLHAHTAPALQTVLPVILRINTPRAEAATPGPLSRPLVQTPVRRIDPVMPPIGRTLARLAANPEDNAPAKHPASVVSTITEQQERVTRRVVTTNQRIEERGATVPLTLARRSNLFAQPANMALAPMPSERAATPWAASEPNILESPRGARVGTAGMMQTAPTANAIDLGRLTEQVIKQIDERIIAHRERTGKLF